MTTTRKHQLLQVLIWGAALASFLGLAHCAHKGVLLKGSDSALEACVQYAKEQGDRQMEQDCSMAHSAVEVIELIDKLATAKQAKLAKATVCPVPSGSVQQIDASAPPQK